MKYLAIIYIKNVIDFIEWRFKDKKMFLFIIETFSYL